MSKPEETGGGILADEMGMGKSLSMLALVVRTLNAAHSWAVQNDTVIGETSQMPRCKNRSGATLIVASSDRKCNNYVYITASERRRTVMINEWLQELDK
jgi:SWI/SNF-related matrix-associated actin-dependent regulator of chromatin subfamily A3